jgi:riboflavin kinase/FMN adenylyltransferase
VKILRSIDDLPADQPFALTIGMFDGVHRGHRRAIRALVQAARAGHARAVVLTFDPHPAQVLRGSAPPLLCSAEEKLARLAALGVETTVVQHFDKAFADQAPDVFLDRICAGRRMVALVMTGESAFGRDRTGIIETIRRLGAEMNFRVIEVPRVESTGGTLSSTSLRALVAEGQLAKARSLLGRDHAVIGRVVKGNRRGRDLGYPTANLEFEKPVVLPVDGIYAVRASWGGRDPLKPSHRAEGVASLGVRPTFGGGDRLLEVHLFDLDRDLYGTVLRVEFVRRLRGEKMFGSVAALVRQMDRDSARARRILATVPPQSLALDRTTRRAGANKGPVEENC